MEKYSEVIKALDVVREFCNDHDSCEQCALRLWCIEYVKDSWLDFRAREAIHILEKSNGTR